MEKLPLLGGPREPIYTTTVRTWNKAKAYARQNRRAPTPAENHLGQHLRAAQLGVKFRRQHAIDFFIVDFVCLSHKLIIEVNGKIHPGAEPAEYDSGRTFVLKELGFHELRFFNSQVLPQLADVLAGIRQYAARFTPPAKPGAHSPGTPSFVGAGTGG